MRLNASSRIAINGNVNLLRYCQDAGISMDKLKECNIEKMGDNYVYVLSKENAPRSNALIPLDKDLETQPDVVLIMHINTETSQVEFETTSKTMRVLAI
jgi:hypothetical protein